MPPDRFGDPDARGAPQPPSDATQPVVTPPPPAAETRTVPVPGRPGSLARLISVIVSFGLAWALVVAITAWLLGLFLTRG